MNTKLSETEAFIQGSWTSSSGPGLGRARTWGFSAGQFKIEAYPRFRQQGRYRILDEAPDRLILELFNQTGNLPAEDCKIEVRVNRQLQYLYIDGTRPYTRCDGTPQALPFP